MSGDVLVGHQPPGEGDLGQLLPLAVKEVEALVGDHLDLLLAVPHHGDDDLVGEGDPGHLLVPVKVVDTQQRHDVLPLHGDPGAAHPGAPGGEGHVGDVAVLDAPAVHQFEPGVVGQHHGVHPHPGLGHRDGPVLGDVRRQQAPPLHRQGVQLLGLVVHPQVGAPQVVGEDLAPRRPGLGGAVVVEAAVDPGPAAVVDVGPGAGDHRHILAHGQQPVDGHPIQRHREAPAPPEGGGVVLQLAAQVQLVDHRDGKDSGGGQGGQDGGGHRPPEQPLAPAFLPQLVELAGPAHLSPLLPPMVTGLHYTIRIIAVEFYKISSPG